MRIGRALAPLFIGSLALTAAACSGDDDALSLDHDLLRARFPEQASRVLGVGASMIATSRGFAPAIDRAIDVELPRDASDPVRIRARTCAIAVREVGMLGEGEIVEGAVAYRRAGGTSYWSALPRGAEEWLHLGAVRAGTIVAAWDVEGASLRGRDDIIEIVDDAGEGCLAVSAPEAFDAGGRPIGVKITAHGARIELVVDTDADGVLIDPMWAQVGSMALGRSRMGAVLLPTGKVLVTGGTAVNPSPAELYDATTGTFSSTGSMAFRRLDTTATMLATGKVLVVGGYLGSIVPLESELYDATTGTFSISGSMSTSRSSHTATLLKNGKVLIAGGIPPGTIGTAIAGCELYDAASGLFAITGSLSIPRGSHTATLLADGRVLVAGGNTPVGGVLVASATADIYDPAMGTWSPASPMSLARQIHSATRLADGRVLVAGGNGAAITGTAEIFNPVTGTWTATGTLARARWEHTATLLGTGSVLVVGGAGSVVPLPGNSSELFDPATGLWSFAGSLVTSHALASATLLGNGSVLIAGGQTFISEVYDPSNPNGAPCSQGADCKSGFCADGVCCSTACNAGACDACSIAAGAQIDGICYPLTGNACDDGDSCSIGDICSAGACLSGTPKQCPASDQCHLPGTCDPFDGMCDDPKKPEGTPCSDGDACTPGDFCTGGACVSGTPVVCVAPDTCHFDGTCNPITGQCFHPVKQDGAPCDDSDACTQADQCKSGACVGGDPVVCPPTGPCDAAIACDTALGTCQVTPKPDGAPCTGGTCLAGMCNLDMDAGAGGGSTSSSSSSSTSSSSTSSSSTSGSSSSSSSSTSSSSSSSSGDGGGGGGEVVEPNGPRGCGCEAAGSGDRGGLGWAALLGAIAIGARRRRDPHALD